MKVISTNIGQATTFEWKGKQEQTGIFKYPVQESLELGLTDVTSDTVIDRKHHAGVDKACFMFSAEEYDYWKPKYPKLAWDWGMFGENLTISGLDESEIRIGNIYRLGTALVQISQPREPCYKLGIRFNDQQIIGQYVERGFPGTYVRVMETGNVKIGDEMILKDQSENTLTIKQFYDFLFEREKDQQLLGLILENQAVPKYKRERFKKFVQ